MTEYILFVIVSSFGQNYVNMFLRIQRHLWNFWANSAIGFTDTQKSAPVRSFYDVVVLKDIEQEVC